MFERLGRELSTRAFGMLQFSVQRGYAFVGSHAARSKFGLFSSVCGTGNAT